MKLNAVLVERLTSEERALGEEAVRQKHKLLLEFIETRGFDPPTFPRFWQCLEQLVDRYVESVIAQVPHEGVLEFGGSFTVSENGQVPIKEYDNWIDRLLESTLEAMQRMPVPPGMSATLLGPMWLRRGDEVDRSVIVEFRTENTVRTLVLF